MLSIPNRAAVCFFGFALSGCMQSMPTAETITRPTMEAFTRLSSWTPWRSPTEPPPPVVAAVQTSPPVVEPAQQQPAPPEARPQPKPRPAVHYAPQLASQRTRPAAPAPAIIPAAVVTPARAAAPATAARTDTSLPDRMTCQTSHQPGERVRMECKPVE